MIIIKKFSIIMTLLLLFGCAQQRYFREASTISGTMTLDQKVGQLMMVAVPGNAMNRDAELILQKYRPGGIILFGYNLSSFNNNRKFISDMQLESSSRGGVPLFVSIDQEGGRVVRITQGVTQFPGAMAAGVSQDADLVYQWGKIVGLELRMTGVNMNLAPVLDVNNNPHNPVINTRSIGSDPALVAKLGASYLKGLQAGHCIAVGKHFPGHGDTDKDSHLTLPVIRHDLKRLSNIEFVPFKKAINAGVECIMTAHIAFPSMLENNEPATVSKKVLTDILRNELEFKGLIITDDMEMHAISKRQDLGEAAVKSFLAGSDIILISSWETHIPVIINAIKKAVADKRISEQRLNESVHRIVEAKIRYGIIAYENGAFRQGNFLLSEDDIKLLGEAENINAALSRKGLLYFGNLQLVKPTEAVRYFITRNSILRETLLENKKNIICSSFEEFISKTAAFKGKKTVLYFHQSQPDLVSFQSASRYCKNRNIDLVLISSGNPFPLTVSGYVQNGLFSFSDTDESLRQMGYCVNGRFLPRTGGKLYLGLTKN